MPENWWSWWSGNILHWNIARYSRPQWSSGNGDNFDPCIWKRSWALVWKEIYTERTPEVAEQWWILPCNTIEITEVLPSCWSNCPWSSPWQYPNSAKYFICRFTAESNVSYRVTAQHVQTSRKFGLAFGKHRWSTVWKVNDYVHYYFNCNYGKHD